ncbi:MAG: hypothetical protein HN919_18865 [Verrucomicrobia bacterium]|jgi:hypothetical protein|nr:hypothetical protein [Verrucomicrobiota bacterium]MBT7068367.1 hypothetical protein [Verrucomicrobiota bacterium]MBT7698930.1 hypothetical protein [Verrucomicrobiota bacterium]
MNSRTAEQPNYEVGIRLRSCGSFAQTRRRAKRRLSGRIAVILLAGELYPRGL